MTTDGKITQQLLPLHIKKIKTENGKKEVVPYMVLKFKEENGAERPNIVQKFLRTIILFQNLP